MRGYYTRRSAAWATPLNSEIGLTLLIQVVEAQNPYSPSLPHRTPVVSSGKKDAMGHFVIHNEYSVFFFKKVANYALRKISIT